MASLVRMSSSVSTLGSCFKSPTITIFRAQEKASTAGSQIDLRGLIHNQVIIDMFNAQRPLDGIGRAERHRVLAGKLFGIPAEIIHFKALSVTLP